MKSALKNIQADVSHKEKNAEGDYVSDCWAKIYLFKFATHYLMPNAFLRDLYYKWSISICLMEVDKLRIGSTDAVTVVFLDRLRSHQRKALLLPFHYYQVPIEDSQSLDFLAGQIEYLPAGLIKETCLRHANLFEKNGNMADARNSINSLESFLDELFDSLKPKILFPYNPKRLPSYTKYIFSMAVVLGALLISFYLYPGLHKKYIAEKEAYALNATSEARYDKRLKDILALKAALEQYFQKNKTYPKSSGGWDGVASAFGQSKEDWIPGLAPEYIDELPVDPRKSKEPREQYLYISDGMEFKLISHNAEEMDRISKEHPDMVDPKRSSWAFGIWSENAKDW